MINTLRIRDATPADIPALARLHVETWNATYRCVGPSVELRTRQWQNAFHVTDGSWFCFVIENDVRELVGFAKGRPSDHPEFQGELNKLYLLSDYQRTGLGRTLVCLVARRFLERGVTDMWLSADPNNPSCRFFEALGAERLYDAAGAFHGGYGWRDLHPLIGLCPSE